MGYRKTGDFLERLAEERASRGKKYRGAKPGEYHEPGRVLACYGRICIVHLESGEERKMPLQHPLSAVTGDYVETDGQRIVYVAPREKVLARADKSSTQVIAANIDRIILVQSATHPPFREGLTDRYRVFATILELPLLLVLNKVDTASETFGRIREVCLRQGIPVLPVSARTGLNMEELIANLESGTSVFSGHSGVGKSSLLSHLLPGIPIGIGELSPTSGLGRQKTTTAKAYAFREGLLIDTPGIRQFGFVGVDPLDVARAFPDIAEIGLGCRFDNCLHDTEPDCAVRQAVEQNILPTEHYESYHRIVTSVRV
jgi:ribosome biogenesis GTPase / thiamine phosphate phosphatase